MEDDTAPYTLRLENIPAGQYRLTARATDNIGGVGDSQPINIVVTSPGGGNNGGNGGGDPMPPKDRPNLALIPSRTSGFFQLNATGGQPNGRLRIEASNDLRTWTAVATQVAADGSLRFLDPDSLGLASRYYRIVPEPQ